MNEDYEDFEDHDCYDDCDCEFQDPGGNSSLRRATENNPRNLPCGQCGEPDRLTPKDVRLHYVCDECADAAEGRNWGP
jgi:hypothetical protein